MPLGDQFFIFYHKMIKFPMLFSNAGNQSTTNGLTKSRDTILKAAHIATFTIHTLLLYRDKRIIVFHFLFMEKLGLSIKRMGPGVKLIWYIYILFLANTPERSDMIMNNRQLKGSTNALIEKMTRRITGRRQHSKVRSGQVRQFCVGNGPRLGLFDGLTSAHIFFFLQHSFFLLSPCGLWKIQTARLKIQLNPAITDVKGSTSCISERRIFIVANMENEQK